MTCQEIINMLENIATAYGLEAIDKSDDYTLRIEYRKNGRYVGGTSYVGATENPGNIKGQVLRDAEIQIAGIAQRLAQQSVCK